ncbi:right-handed parallel beta-helix repeat-containing protein [Methanobrevibacter filiformis]|uniref:Right handed beta helix domain-containing protein n=1 Tax=Methanobrevibacter filiformis TaxID=55758 RepID=A0A166EV19_9EURY|nr:hypothetical protein [Methanobrevibacter filiformis]KZX17044.1 hypothetical protein MBFIL_03950 [Methanobrevibacter filiformis]
MEFKSRIILVIVILCVLVFCSFQGISATSHSINSGNTSAQIQSLINESENGDIIEFASGDYDNIELSINKNLTLSTNGAKLKSNMDKTIITFDSGSNGSSVNGFKFSSNLYAENSLIDVKASNINIINNEFSGASMQIQIIGSESASTEYSLIKNNKFNGSIDSESAAIYINNFCPNIFIDGNNISNQKDGVTVRSANVSLCQKVTS